MAEMEGLGRLYNIVAIAAGVGISLRDAESIEFICTGNDTFTVTVASSFGGSYATPGNIITRKYTNTSTNGSAKWVKATQSASNAVTISSGTVKFWIGQSQLSDPSLYVKCSAGGSGLVIAVLHDLSVQRGPANLAAVGA